MILAAYQLQINTGKGKGNVSKITLPHTAIATKDNNGTLCSKDIQKVQTLTLSWKEKQENDTKVDLNRFIQVDFLRSKEDT